MAASIIQSLRLRSERSNSAFTMIELMIVMGIVAMIMSLGIPSFLKLVNKDPMRQAVSDLMEGCNEARAQAIITGVPSELRIRPGERSISIGARTQESDSSEPVDTAQTEKRPVARQVAGKGFPKHISERVQIEMLDVNLHELKDTEEARVRFFPNGTSDEFTIIISYAPLNDYRQISLDSISGMANLSSLR